VRYQGKGGIGAREMGKRLRWSRTINHSDSYVGSKENIDKRKKKRHCQIRDTG